MKIQTGTENEVLRAKSKPVGAITGALRSFALDMVKTMEAAEGVGLAAPQVGRHIRMIVCKLNPGEKNEVIVPMINPELLQCSEETAEGEEGCLSVPGTWGQVQRSCTIIVRYKNLKGQELTLQLEDFNARVIQHEIDHLNGVLFTDKARDIKKDPKKAKASSEI
jgi:peptide deformylase